MRNLPRRTGTGTLPQLYHARLAAVRYFCGLVRLRKVIPIGRPDFRTDYAGTLTVVQSLGCLSPREDGRHVTCLSIA